MLTTVAFVHATVVTTAARLQRRSGDEGQTTAEYALVLLAAAAVAMLVMAWATKTKAVGKLLDTVLDQVVGRVL